MSNRESFDCINNWIKECVAHCKSGVPFILVGNKCDIQKRQVSIEEGKACAQKYNCDFLETSAKLNINIDKLFELIAIKMTDSFLLNLQRPIEDPVSLEDRHESIKCC